MLRAFKSVFPSIDPTAYVDTSAQIIGDVHVGPESSIWMNVVIRGDVNAIRIGARTNIQDLTLVHLANDLGAYVGRYCTVGHRAIIHACQQMAVHIGNRNHQQSQWELLS